MTNDAQDIIWLFFFLKLNYRNIEVHVHNIVKKIMHAVDKIGLVFHEKKSKVVGRKRE